jgi:hypothetical protein
VHQYFDLSLISKSSVKDLYAIKIMDSTTMTIACDLFGRTFGIGSWSIPPCKVLPTDGNPPRRIWKVKPVPCDTSFIYNDKYFIVTQSDGRRVFTVCTNDGEQICFSNDDLWLMILGNL